MRSIVYVLEDDPLVITLFELWCKKFKIKMVLNRSVDQFWKGELPKKRDFCLLDIDLIATQVKKNMDLIDELLKSTNCFMTNDGVTRDTKTYMQLPVYSKIKALELLENMYFLHESNFENITFL